MRRKSSKTSNPRAVAAVAAACKRLLSIASNKKLGPRVASFSLPALKTCPGATPTCRAICYAARGHYIWESTQAKYARNHRARHRDSFVKRICQELATYRVQTCRIHGSGDFDSVEYLQKWIAIAEQTPGTVFFAYTRSWSEPWALAPMAKFAALPNVRLWLSQDVDSKPLPQIPHTLVAWLALDDADLAKADPKQVSLVFRNHPKTVVKKTDAGLQVCPVEDGVRRERQVTCSTCSICFDHAKPRNLWTLNVHKLPLALAPSPARGRVGGGQQHLQREPR